MQPESNGIKTWQWVITVIVIIALIIIGIFVFGNKSPVVEPIDTEPVTTPTTQTQNSIIMSDQFPGNVVYVTSVQAETDGWIVIHKDNAGQPGDVIGYAAVAAGTAPVKVTLSKPTVDGGVYYAMLHADDGDKKFDATKDLPLKDAKGDMILRIFRASATALEPKG